MQAKRKETIIESFAFPRSGVQQLGSESGTGCAPSAEITPVEPALARTSEGMSLNVHKDAMERAIEQVRSQQPLVQCLTNTVVQGLTANVLAAVGASPAMCDTPAESADFAKISSGVLINTGTPNTEQYAGMRAAAKSADANGTPWVLDPVAAGVLPERSKFLRKLLKYHPTCIRGNASEIMALAELGQGGRGVDSTQAVQEAIPAARALLERGVKVVAISGERDLIISKKRVTWLASGDPMLQTVVGSGCSLGAMTAAYLGARKKVSAHNAVVAAHAHVGAAAQIAAANSSGPGSFAVAWLDALYHLTPEQILAAVEVKEG